MSLSDVRNIAFRKNELLERLLRELSEDLQPAESLLASRYKNSHCMEFPLVLVMGPLRSGTTLFMQWLANTGLTAYPTNLLSRFYQVPIIGAKIQLLLTDPRFSFRDELVEFSQQAEYKSENGKTRGALAPNEFWYFWRRFLAEPARDAWTDEELRLSMDMRTMRAELAGMMAVFQKPFAAKGMLFNYNIPLLDSVFDKVLFIQIRRDPVANVASVLEARKRQLGSEAAWYSFRIPEYKQLRGLSPVSQSAGQVYYINKAIARGMASVNESRKLVVDYEEFCRQPSLFYNALVDKLNRNGCAVNADYRGVSQFGIIRPMMQDSEILNALKEFEGK